MPKRGEKLIEEVKKEIEIVIPMLPNLELAAANMASAVAGFMEFNEEKIEEMKMALIEACINSFEHSKSQDRKVYIKFRMEKDELWLEITDHGTGFKADEVALPNIDKKIAGEERKRGWGLELMRGLMDRVEVRTSEKGTTILMMKKRNG